jgi:transposase
LTCIPTGLPAVTGTGGADRPQDRVTKTFELNDAGLAAFYATLTADTYVLVEATITTFSFVRLFKDQVKEVIIGNTYQLKQISLARNNTDKIDADKLCQALKAQILSGVQQIVPVALPPVEIQQLRSLFSTYRLYQKQNTQIKNRIHSLLKEQLYGFTQEEIFGKKERQKIREISEKAVLRFQINQLMDRLERDEAGCGSAQRTGAGGGGTLHGADRGSDEHEGGERIHRRSDHRGYYRREPVQELQTFYVLSALRTPCG